MSERILHVSGLGWRALMPGGHLEDKQKSGHLIGAIRPCEGCGCELPQNRENWCGLCQGSGWPPANVSEATDRIMKRNVIKRALQERGFRMTNGNTDF